MKIKSLAELTGPDDRSLRFTPLGFSTGGTLDPEYAAEFQQRVIAGCDLHPDVGEGTRQSFERVRMLHCYGVLFYDAFTAADDLAWLVMEQALRERFVSYFAGVVPFVNATTGIEESVAAIHFDQVYKAVTHGGSHAKGSWKLRLRGTGELIEFRASLAHLQEWARREGLLQGQRNKRLETVHRRIRNSVAHPSHHLVMPNDSAQTIRDLAEIINRLWGHVTPGGRLYPAPLEREVLVVGWTEGEHGPPALTRIRADQLGQADGGEDWSYVVILGVPSRDDHWEFDAQFERTNFPSELLWGPGSRSDALAWLEAEQPTGDTVEYLDRLFALRIHDGKVSLPRRPAVALALPAHRCEGEWRIVRADFPNDAFAHVRHIKDGESCREPVLDRGCPVEDVVRGDWATVATQLGKRFNITPAATLSAVRVPPQWKAATDVEDE